MPKRKKQQQPPPPPPPPLQTAKCSVDLGKKKLKTSATTKSGKATVAAVVSSGKYSTNKKTVTTNLAALNPYSISNHHQLRLRPKNVFKTAEELVNNQLLTPEGQLELIANFSLNQSLGSDLIQSVNAHVERIVETVKLKKRVKKKSRSVQIQELENSKIDLSTPDSILCSINLSNAINRANFLKLPSYYQFCLLKLLPKSDQMILPNNVTCPDPKAFNNDYFSRALNSFSTRLMEGRLTTEAITRLRKELERGRNRLDPLKIKYFEPHFKIPEDQQQPERSESVRLGLNYLCSLVGAYYEYKKLWPNGVADMEKVNQIYAEIEKSRLAKLKFNFKNLIRRKNTDDNDDHVGDNEAMKEGEDTNTNSEEKMTKNQLPTSILLSNNNNKSSSSKGVSLLRRKRKGDDPFINGIKDSKSDRIVTEVVTDNLFDDDYPIVAYEKVAKFNDVNGQSTTATTVASGQFSLPPQLSPVPMHDPSPTPNSQSINPEITKFNNYKTIIENQPPESSGPPQQPQQQQFTISDQFIIDDHSGTGSVTSVVPESSHFDEVRFFIENICIQTIKKIAALLRLWAISTASLVVGNMHYELLPDLKQTVMKQLSSSIKWYQFLLGTMYKFVKFGKIKRSDALKLAEFRLEQSTSQLPWDFSVSFRHPLPPNGMRCFYPLNNNFFKKMSLKADQMFALCNRMVDVKPILADKMMQHFQAAAQLKIFHRWAITAIDMAINITDPERRDILLGFCSLYN